MGARVPAERYFSDPHQAEPEWGFTGLIANMIGPAQEHTRKAASTCKGW